MTQDNYHYRASPKKADKFSTADLSTDIHRVTKYGYVEQCPSNNSAFYEKSHHIVKFNGYVVQCGAESACGGEWQPRPDKLEDERFLGNHVLKSDSEGNSKHFDSCILMQQLTDHCDYYFKKCGDCGEQCTHPSGKCSGSCADCLKEIQWHRTDGRTEYDCKNMLRYYTCHTMMLYHKS